MVEEKKESEEACHGRSGPALSSPVARLRRLRRRPWPESWERQPGRERSSVRVHRVLRAPECREPAPPSAPVLLATRVAEYPVVRLQSSDPPRPSGPPSGAPCVTRVERPHVEVHQEFLGPEELRRRRVACAY